MWSYFLEVNDLQNVNKLVFSARKGKVNEKLLKLYFFKILEMA